MIEFADRLAKIEKDILELKTAIDYSNTVVTEHYASPSEMDYGLYEIQYEPGVTPIFTTMTTVGYLIGSLQVPNEQNNTQLMSLYDWEKIYISSNRRIVSIKKVSYTPTDDSERWS